MLSLRASELTRVMMSEADAIEGLFRALFEEGKTWMGEGAISELFWHSFTCSPENPMTKPMRKPKAGLSLWPVLCLC